MNIDIDTLTEAWLNAKAREKAANEYRLELETQIIAILGNKPEGSETHQTASGHKVTITGKMTYSADMPMLMAICSALPEAIRPIKTKTELDQTGAKYLRTNMPDVWSQIAPAITMKPAKTSIEIK